VSLLCHSPDALPIVWHQAGGKKKENAFLKEVAKALFSGGSLLLDIFLRNDDGNLSEYFWASWMTWELNRFLKNLKIKFKNLKKSHHSLHYI